MSFSLSFIPHSNNELSPNTKMPPEKKRKTRSSKNAEEEVKPIDTPQEDPAPAQPSPPATAGTEEAPAVTKSPPAAEDSSAADDAAVRAKERQDRFKALQARAKTSNQKNMKEAALESQRLATDPSLLTTLNRKHATATQKLVKADVEASGEDFERKRAWDWTAEESERWDKRLKKKEAHRDNQAFQDYRQDGNKVYKRQVNNMKPDMENYEKEKLAAVQRAARSGNLEIVETGDGELVAVDKDGSFYSTANSTNFVENRPDKSAVDRLVNDLKQAEETRLKKRKERMQDRDEGDVTHINEPNKMFNHKLSRFYNKVCLRLTAMGGKLTICSTPLRSATASSVGR